ncbi:hypothetical protein CH35J_007936 [Colletotrichum higginsianum]|nr:hypothetical protein CH35J_007936 [Colletotrichum higginsianum]
MKGKPLLILAAVAGIATAQVKLSSFTVSGSIYIGCAVINNVATETFDFPVSGLTPQLCHSMPFSGSVLRRRGRAPAILIASAARVALAALAASFEYVSLHSRHFTAVYLSYFFQRFSDKQRYFDIGVASLEPIGVPKKQYRGRTALFKRVQLGLSRSSDDLAPFDFHLHHHHRRRHHYIQLGHHTGY